MTPSAPTLAGHITGTYLEPIYRKDDIGHRRTALPRKQPRQMYPQQIPSPLPPILFILQIHTGQLLCDMSAKDIHHVLLVVHNHHKIVTGKINHKNNRTKVDIFIPWQAELLS